MAHRHKAQAKGKNIGGATPYNTQGSKVLKEAKAKKDGGKVSGMKSGGRLDKRARGGRVGSNSHPFSTAYVK